MAELRNITTSNIGIIHLSDIHFSSESNSVQQKLEFLYHALKDDFSNCLVVYVVVSGDIANYGKSQEYKVAKGFFTKLLELLLARYSSTQFKFVFVPGNHDCNFDLDTQARINATKDINYETIGTDDSVLKMCLQVQDDFWDFYTAYGDAPANRIFIK